MIIKNRRRRPPAQALVRQGPWTLIGPGSVVHGELLMSGDVLVHGRVEGIVFTDGEVQVAEGGSVDGGIHARRVVLEGTCEGRLEATEEVTLRSGSVVRGDIDARILTVHDGARFLGQWLRGKRRSRPTVLPYQTPPGNA
jgi:cytoskeletal protein CcmA (bactofilin family)